MPESRKEKIYLKENQIPHVEKLEGILASHYCAFDISMMGAGKTYTTSELSLRLEFEHVIVICPASVESKWRGMVDYGVNLRHVISYDSLRSKKGKQPKHGLLERKDTLIMNKKGQPERGVIFTPTPELITLINEGLLIVFDEAQKFKNKNDVWHACQALSTAVLKNGGMSRFILLSGTPFDKEEHALHMCKMLGFIRAAKLYVYDNEDRVLKLYGAQELIDYCNMIDLDATRSFLRYHPFSKDNVKDNCYNMFQKIIKPAIAVAMPSPKLDINIKNGYYKIINKEDSDALTAAIASLGQAARYNPESGRTEVTGNSFGLIQIALGNIEKAKLNDMARIAREQLEANPNCKVAIFLNFKKDSIYKLAEIMSDYKPIIYNGDVHKNKRADLAAKFQEPNTKHRLFLGNVLTCSVGIDLDDKQGDFPRFVLSSADYKINELHQLTRRFVRLDTKSVCKFRFFYGDVGRLENSILNSLAKKAKVMEDTLEGQKAEGVLFPGQYTDEYERDENGKSPLSPRFDEGEIYGSDED